MKSVAHITGAFEFGEKLRRLTLLFDLAENVALAARRNRLVRINVQKDTMDVLNLPAGIMPDTGPVASMDNSQLNICSISSSVCTAARTSS